MNILLSQPFDDAFLFFPLQGIFPACYIHIKDATVEGSGSVPQNYCFLKISSLLSGATLPMLIVVVAFKCLGPGLAIICFNFAFNKTNV